MDNERDELIEGLADTSVGLEVKGMVFQLARRLADKAVACGNEAEADRLRWWTPYALARALQGAGEARAYLHAAQLVLLIGKNL